jgi:C1A family cysteine protease
VLRAQGACIIKKAYFDPQTEKVVETGVCPVSLKEGIKANRWATRVEEMRAAIAAGKPVSIGVNWYAEFDNPEQFVVGTRREFWIAKDGLPEGSRTRGGHCVCVYGASDKRQAFKIKNSWGIEYPEVWLPYGVMQRLLDEYGEAALVTDR